MKEFVHGPGFPIFRLALLGYLLLSCMSSWIADYCVLKSPVKAQEDIMARHREMQEQRCQVQSNLHGQMQRLTPQRPSSVGSRSWQSRDLSDMIGAPPNMQSQGARGRWSPDMFAIQHPRATASPGLQLEGAKEPPPFPGAAPTSQYQPSPGVSPFIRFRDVMPAPSCPGAPLCMPLQDAIDAFAPQRARPGASSAMQSPGIHPRDILTPAPSFPEFREMLAPQQFVGSLPRMESQQHFATQRPTPRVSPGMQSRDVMTPPPPLPEFEEVITPHQLSGPFPGIHSRDVRPPRSMIGTQSRDFIAPQSSLPAQVTGFRPPPMIDGLLRAQEEILIRQRKIQNQYGQGQKMWQELCI